MGIRRGRVRLLRDAHAAHLTHGRDPATAATPEEAMLALDEKESRRLAEVDAYFDLRKSNEPMRLPDEAGARLQEFGGLTYKDMPGRRQAYLKPEESSA